MCSDFSSFPTLTANSKSFQTYLSYTYLSHYPESISYFLFPSCIHHFLEINPQTPLVPKSSLIYTNKILMTFLLVWPPYLISEFSPGTGLYQCISKCVVGNNALWDVNVHRRHMTKGAHVEISWKSCVDKVLSPYPLTSSPELLSDVNLQDGKIIHGISTHCS